MADSDERIDLFQTPRDWLRYAIGRFRGANLAFGHGATTALDEAAYLILEGLHLPIDTLDPFLDAKLLISERRRLDALIEARATTRKPAAYLVNRAYIQGVPFYVDERVIVPRSFIGELLMTALSEDGSPIDDPEAVVARPGPLHGRRLARHPRRAGLSQRCDRRGRPLRRRARRRRGAMSEEHGLADRIRLLRGNLFQPLGNERYDLILTNPPYVDAEAVAAFPPEYAGRAAHGPCGRRGRPRHRAAHPRRRRPRLSEEGVLICEIGRGARPAPARVPGPSVRLARHRGERRRGVPSARVGLRRSEGEGEAKRLEAGGFAQARPRVGPQDVDRRQGARPLDMPESPAVAGRQTLHERADLVDRADRRAGGERPVHTHQRRVAAGARRRAGSPALTSAGLDEAGEGDARLAAAGRRDRDRLFGERLDRRDTPAAPPRRRSGSRSMPMKERRSLRATAPVVPEPKNGSSTRSPALEAATSTRASSASGFWVGCSLAPGRVLQALAAGADRQEPVGAHLNSPRCRPSAPRS